MKIKSCIYILLACYLATYLRIFINNIFIVSLIGSFFVGLVLAKRLSYTKEEIILSGFFSCFTSFSGFIYFLHEIIIQQDWIKFLIYLNFFIIINLFMMCIGFYITRKIT